MGHGLIGICGYLLQKFHSESKSLMNQYEIDRVPMSEGRFYEFRHTNKPILDVLYDFYGTLGILEKVSHEDEKQQEQCLDKILEQRK